MTVPCNGRPDFCLLEAKVGRCRAHFIRYFYNHSSGLCEEFVYGGCEGNPNNFETKAECQRSCGDPDDSAQATAPSTPGTAKRNAGVQDFNYPSWCLTGADRGQCTANVTRFYYDSDAATCRTFSYGGCGGNENNFVSERACLKACTKAFTKRTPEGRLMETKRIKNSVEIGYEIY
ncbi:tissue factor pathway inhibitor-like [Myotis daubentonii]|uniref:tissue factor pathway inhibitor-like n=1 Tax=Myotis daubentonii TaxID=98922 RepID=UPI0028738B6F|nr:tissue factor pathway inhibitor-like [Myotis daubentonii]